MAKFVVLYRFTPEGTRIARESVKRAGRIRQENAMRGFRIIEVFWTQGQYDMVAIVDAPSEEAMMGAMLNVVEAGNVTSTTLRAFDALEMSRILALTPDDTPEPAPAPAGRKAPPKNRAPARHPAKPRGRARRR
ncbi:MAG: GYD domain-containing protein [Dehalococcoidia bacterium]